MKQNCSFCSFGLRVKVGHANDGAPMQAVQCRRNPPQVIPVYQPPRVAGQAPALTMTPVYPVIPLTDPGCGEFDLSERGQSVEPALQAELDKQLGAANDA